MNYLHLYEHALAHIHATTPDADQLLARWRTESPSHCSDRDLLMEYGWVVASCGLTPQVILKRWDQLGEAFCSWDPKQVAAQEQHVRIAALAAMRNPRKITAILQYAVDLAHEPGEMQRLASLPLKEVLARLVTLPFVGENNRYHLARNLGWDVVVRTGPVCRLAAYLGLSSEELCGAIAAETGERLRTVDLILWQWGHQVGDSAMKEMASLFRLM